MIYIYTRVSTQGQAEKGDSIAGQIKKCKAWAIMEDVEDEVCILEEKAVSGGIPLFERPKGKELFSRLKDGDFVICYRLDRIFRNSLDALQVTETFTKMGVGLVLLNIAHKDITRDAVGKLILAILAAVAEMEKETIRARMMDGKESKRAKGFWCGGRPPFGYKIEKTENGSILVKDPEKTPALLFILGCHKEGMPLRKIEEELKSAGYKISFATIGRVIRKDYEQ